VQAQLSRPFLSPGAFITPKLMLHTSMYQTDQLMSNGSKSANRTLPTFSLDSGLIFERDTSWFGKNLLQTFEPRAFYTYTPIATRACCRSATRVAATSTSRVFFRERLCRPGPIADNH
jgi:lipopolysaccharide assembly outer membrane protein LptD (OstA)